MRGQALPQAGLGRLRWWLGHGFDPAVRVQRVAAGGPGRVLAEHPGAPTSPYRIELTADERAALVALVRPTRQARMLLRARIVLAALTRSVTLASPESWACARTPSASGAAGTPSNGWPVWLTHPAQVGRRHLAWDVHRGRVFGRCENTTGIAPFGRLVQQVMITEPYASANRVFGRAAGTCLGLAQEAAAGPIPGTP